MFTPEEIKQQINSIDKNNLSNEMLYDDVRKLKKDLYNLRKENNDLRFDNLQQSEYIDECKDEIKYLRKKIERRY